MRHKAEWMGHPMRLELTLAILSNTNNFKTDQCNLYYNLKTITTPRQSEPESNGNEKVLHSLDFQNRILTVRYSLMLHPGCFQFF